MGSWVLPFLVPGCGSGGFSVGACAVSGGASAPPSAPVGVDLPTALPPSPSPALPADLLASPSSAACGGCSLSGHSSSGMSWSASGASP